MSIQQFYILFFKTTCVTVSVTCCGYLTMMSNLWSKAILPGLEKCKNIKHNRNVNVTEINYQTRDSNVKMRPLPQFKVQFSYSYSNNAYINFENWTLNCGRSLILHSCFVSSNESLSHLHFCVLCFVFVNLSFKFPHHSLFSMNWTGLLIIEADSFEVDQLKPVDKKSPLNFGCYPDSPWNRSAHWVLARHTFIICWNNDRLA